jgi:carbonic anhydrase/acetyltransferase-like protein (isoleucine patch superfamily)
MILSHMGRKPAVDPSAYVAPNATVCGDVTVAAGTRIMFGACVVAEGKPITLGKNSIVMENAVIRSTDEHRAAIGDHCLIGPQSHLVGCVLEDCVFIASGATVLHGARLGYNSEVRVNGVVQLRTELAAHAVVPIGWVAVGTPARILPTEEHEEIWAVQKPLNFPHFVYGVERAPEGETNMPDITARRSDALGRHRADTVENS